MTSQDAIRTCIGCRRRGTATELLRVVAAPDTSGEFGRLAAEAGSGEAAPIPVVPDPRRGMPGRGAWLHRDPGCLELAQRRRAFGRALKVSGTTDPTPVVEYVTAHYGEHDRNRSSMTTRTSGTPQETKS